MCNIYNFNHMNNTLKILYKTYSRYYYKGGGDDSRLRKGKHGDVTSMTMPPLRRLTRMNYSIK